MPGSIIIGAIGSTPQGKALIKEVTDFIANLKCRFKGSCSPKFQEIVKKTGGAIGYYRLDEKGVQYYFLNDTQMFRNQSEMEIWYKASGTWRRFKDAGLDPCCLKQTVVPTEAFTVAADGKGFGGTIELKIDGFSVLVDKMIYDPSVHKFASSFVSQTPSDREKTETNGAVPGGVGILPLAAAAYFVTK